MHCSTNSESRRNVSVIEAYLLQLTLSCCVERHLLITWLVSSAGFKPFMEYAGSYALFNYRLEEPEKGLEYDNLRLIRAFEHGLDPTSSEAGFVLVHVAMVKESGALVKGAAEALEGCFANDRERFDEGLRILGSGLKKVNAVMNSMHTPCYRGF